MSTNKNSIILRPYGSAADPGAIRRQAWSLPLTNHNKIKSKSARLESKIHEVRVPNLSKSVPRSVLEGSWAGLRAILGHLSPKRHPRGTKRPTRLRKGRAFPPSQRAPSREPPPLLRPKIDLKGIQKVIFFMIVFYLKFLSHLDPTWVHLGSQNHPKMDPSCHQNPSKLAHGFNTCFLKDVGSILLIFCPNLTLPT